MVVNGITLKNETVLVIDVLETMKSRKELGTECIVSYVRELCANLETLIIIVGQLTISTVERESSFIKALAKMFYSLENPKITQCHLVNTPRTFSTIFSMIKPLLTKDVINMINVVSTKDASKTNCPVPV